MKSPFSKLNLLPDPKSVSEAARARVLKSSAFTVLLLYFTGTAVLWFFVFAQDVDWMLLAIAVLCIALGQVLEVFIYDRNQIANSRIDRLDPSIRTAFIVLYHGGLCALLLQALVALLF